MHCLSRVIFGFHIFIAEKGDLNMMVLSEHGTKVKYGKVYEQMCINATRRGAIVK